MDQKTDIIKYGSIHKVLAHSYLFYFFTFLVALCLNFLFPFKFFTQNISSVMYFGLVLLIIATFLIGWAQRTSRHLERENINKETFCRGPYCYTRSPTHWGLFLLLFGFGLIANSTFMIFLSVLAFLITKFVFIKKEEVLLVQKYGAPYLEYQKIVRF